MIWPFCVPPPVGPVSVTRGPLSLLLSSDDWRTLRRLPDSVQLTVTVTRL